MARPERPLPFPSGPIRDFAAALRELRRRAGGISYREMAKSAHFSAAHLARAADGRALPTWEVVHAYVRVCGGDVEEWRARWQAAERRNTHGPVCAAVVVCLRQPGAPYQFRVHGRQRPSVLKCQGSEPSTSG